MGPFGVESTGRSRFSARSMLVLRAELVSFAPGELHDCRLHA